jgi:hypothetical protein
VLAGVGLCARSDGKEPHGVIKMRGSKVLRPEALL